MTVMSYMDSLDFGLLGCPDVLPEIGQLADGLHGARRARRGHRCGASRDTALHPLHPLHPTGASSSGQPHAAVPRFGLETGVEPV